MRVLAISGSLRRHSHNSALIDAAAACPCTVEFDVWGGLAEIPAYNDDLGEPPPAAVVDLRKQIARADALLIATPEYNGSVPGALKNALDWASRPYPENCLRRKPVAVIGASTGLFGARWAQADLRKVLKTIGASVLETELPIASAHMAFDEDGTLRQPELRLALCNILAELLDRALADAA